MVKSSIFIAALAFGVGCFDVGVLEDEFRGGGNKLVD